jgi:hypothetical protein
MKTFLALCQQKHEQVLASVNKHQDKPLELSIHADYIGQGPDKKLSLTFGQGNSAQTIFIPIPYNDENGNLIIGHRVERAVGTWHHQGKEMTYWELMLWLLTDKIETAFPRYGKRVQWERMVAGYSSSNAAIVFRDVQDLVDKIVNRLPLVGTSYEAWAMCRRVVFLDPEFDSLTPKKALEYQKNLNIKHFPWTSLGLSDSAMVENYLLKADLRSLTPFGIKHHNPKRNLYQTLGMKGDETPIVITKSAKELAGQGVERTGWNFMTCFLDTPYNFEDQLIVDQRHQDKFTCEERKFICFGEVKVCAGETLNEGDVVSVEPGSKEVRFWTKADSAVVTDVATDLINFNGKEQAIKVVIVRTKHIFKEGIKLTNCHGNKGIVAFADCGTMVDAGRNKENKIDIIVSAKTVNKRKNYGQVLEVLTTLMLGTDAEIVLPDNAQINIDKLKEGLVKRGYAADGTSNVSTPWGKFNAICGWGFWGLIKNPEEQLWDRGDVMATDARALRTAGLKISHIELKALMTIFGAKNPVVDEILSYQQGLPDVQEMLSILSIMRGASQERPLVDWQTITPLYQTKAYFHPQDELRQTIVDQTLQPEGFALTLPRVYHVFIPEAEHAEIEERLLPENAETDLESFVKPGGRNVFLNRLLVPSTRLRYAWQHQTGLWGFSDLGALLNNIIINCHKLVRDEATEEQLEKSIKRYYAHIGSRLSTKKGEVATYALSIRYPNSIKAVASLAKEGLPENTVEIHEESARDLGVVDGDYVLAERFPCLGFKSIRIQRVRVTDDVQCKSVIRVSGNSLVSQNLDFDGDVIYLMSFKSEAANQTLEKEFTTPDPDLKRYLDEANAAKVPCLQSINLDEMNVTVFPQLTSEKQAEIVGDLTGVKRGTGTTVALAYNLMRIIEGSVGYNDNSTNLAMEVILDKVANSVFSQKHSGESLEEKSKAAICCGDSKALIGLGFPEYGSIKLCEIIRKEALSLGIRDLDKHYENHLTKGFSSIINLIVRKKHKIYYSTRANLHPVRLMEHLESEPTDLVAFLWKRGLKRLLQEQTINETNSDTY